MSQAELLLNVSQHKGEKNSIRVFANEELLDEIDTKVEPTSYAIPFDLETYDLNSIQIQVLNHKTIVSDNFKILSSNDVTINHCIIRWVENNYAFDICSNSGINFIRSIDPIYQIYAQQKNLVYKKINLGNLNSIGNGFFIQHFFPMTYEKVPGEIQHSFMVNPLFLNNSGENIDFTYTDINGKLDILTIEKCWDDQNEKFIDGSEGIIERFLKLLKIKYKAWDHNKKYFEKFHDNVESFKININKAISFYED